jgi:hypothetical protein
MPNDVLYFAFKVREVPQVTRLFAIRLQRTLEIGVLVVHTTGGEVTRRKAKLQYMPRSVYQPRSFSNRLGGLWSFHPTTIMFRCPATCA